MGDILNRIMTVLPETSKEDQDRFKNNLAIILNDYEIKEKSAELVLIDSDKTDKAVKMFFISKKVEGCTDGVIADYTDPETGEVMDGLYIDMPWDGDTIGEECLAVYRA